MIIKIFLTMLLLSLSQKKEKTFIRTENMSKKNEFSVVILTETQGYVHHAAIKEGVKLITRLGKENNFNVTHTNSSEYLSNKVLKKSDVLIFLCTTLDVLNEINKILNDQKVGEIIREGFKIAIVGPTNAGKSSLLNYLSKREAAIVSETAGTTRDVIEVHLNLDGYPVIISDTAGIRDSKDDIEKKGIKLALKKVENADLKLVVLDAKNPNLSDFFKDLLKRDGILVINKSDLIDNNLNTSFKNISHVLISLKENRNLDVLISNIKKHLKNKFTDQDDVLITRERHRQHLIQCAKHLKDFEKKNEVQDFDKAAEDLRLATKHLGMIVGKVDVEEILGSIFNDFCIGK